MAGVPWYKRVGVWIGLGTGPGALMLGGGLAASLSLPSLLLAIPLGGLVLTGLAVAQGVVSRRRGEPLGPRAVGTFGASPGARLLSLAVALGMVGWIGFYASMVGYSWTSYLGLPLWLGALAVAVGMFALSLLGIDRWNLLVVVTTLSTLAVAMLALNASPRPSLEATSQSEGFLGLLWGTGAVVSYGVLFALRVGDFTWDLEADSDVWKDSAGLLMPLLIFLGIGVYAYSTLGEWNLAEILARSHSPLVGNAFLLLSVVGNAMGAFHSGSLAIQSLIPVGRRWAAALIALIGFALGVTRFDRQLLLFLDLLGAVIPSALVVMLLVIMLARKPSVGSALLAWLVGAGAAVLLKVQGYQYHMLVGISVSIALLAASALLSRDSNQKT
jgi:cytosine permease